MITVLPLYVAEHAVCIYRCVSIHRAGREYEKSQVYREYRCIIAQFSRQVGFRLQKIVQFIVICTLSDSLQIKENKNHIDEQNAVLKLVHKSELTWLGYGQFKPVATKLLSKEWSHS